MFSAKPNVFSTKPNEFKPDNVFFHKTQFISGQTQHIFSQTQRIDVQQVTVVVNFSLPTDQKNQPDFETYLHRIGRTGRFGKRGIAFSMVESGDVGLVLLIEKHFQTKIKQLDPENMDELEKLEN
ncbi:hypothetical protein Q9233_005058 [Columba guinea]|nr:hypothetical protein Q9233_005058 [Columba guinea]